MFSTLSRTFGARFGGTCSRRSATTVFNQLQVRASVHHYSSKSTAGDADADTRDPEEVEKEFEKLKENPMFEKYKEKLEAAKREGKLKLKVATPDPISSAAAPGSADDSDADGESADAGAEAESRLKASPDQNPTMKPLGTILKLELLKDLSPEDVANLWLEYHKDKDCVSAVIPASAYATLIDRAQACPMFLYPLPRDDGFEFYYSQWFGHQCAYTPLIEYQARQEDAEPHMLMNHYQEVRESHGLVLMVGELESKLKSSDAHILASQVAMYYAGSDTAFSLVETFNHRPAEFDHNVVIQRLETLNMD